MTKDLFIKYLQGNCTEEEFKQLLSWIRDGALSSSGVGMVQEIWDEFEPDAGPVEKMKYNRLLDKIHHRINITQNPHQLTVQPASGRNRFLSFITRAAAILLLPVLSLLIYTHLSNRDRLANNASDLEVQAPAGATMQLVLGDGTKVWLNHGSKLKYPYRFGGNNRKVHLTGEAFFRIAHNPEMPFVVGTRQMDVMATGTTFNVSAYPEDDFVETTLVEGRVVLYENKSNQEIKALSPNESLKFVAGKNTYSLETGRTEKNIAWKDGQLLFKNDPIEDIARKLARWYNADIEFTSEKAKQYTCTATFTDETLVQVLELLNIPTPVSFKLAPRDKLPDGSLSKPKVLIGIK